MYAWDELSHERCHINELADEETENNDLTAFNQPFFLKQNPLYKDVYVLSSLLGQVTGENDDLTSCFNIFVKMR
jgi:hypothetical protein